MEFVAALDLLLGIILAMVGVEAFFRQDYLWAACALLVSFFNLHLYFKHNAKAEK